MHNLDDGHWKPISFLPHHEASADGLIRKRETVSEYVSSKGKTIRRHNTGHVLPPRIVKRSPSDGKHPVVYVYKGTSRKNSKSKMYRVAVLVASAHHGVPYDRTNQREIQRWRLMFKDGDELNCCADNLKWVRKTGEAGTEKVAAHDANLRAWEERKKDTGAVMARLFAEVEEDAA